MRVVICGALRPGNKSKVQEEGSGISLKFLSYWKEQRIYASVAAVYTKNQLRLLQGDSDIFLVPWHIAPGLFTREYPPESRWPLGMDLQPIKSLDKLDSPPTFLFRRQSRSAPTSWQSLTEIKPDLFPLSGHASTPCRPKSSVPSATVTPWTGSGTRTLATPTTGRCGRSGWSW